MYLSDIIKVINIQFISAKFSIKKAEDSREEGGIWGCI